MVSAPGFADGQDAIYVFVDLFSRVHADESFLHERDSALLDLVNVESPAGVGVDCELVLGQTQGAPRQ